MIFFSSPALFFSSYAPQNIMRSLNTIIFIVPQEFLLIHANSLEFEIKKENKTFSGHYVWMIFKYLLNMNRSFFLLQR